MQSIPNVPLPGHNIQLLLRDTEAFSGHVRDIIVFWVFPGASNQVDMPGTPPMGDISSHVTITTKTFLRYTQLKALLSSIRRFYSNIKVIIADDSFEPEHMTKEHIEQYFMPPAQPFSRVSDLQVGGTVQGNQFYFSILYEEGEEMEGGCLHRKSKKKFSSLPGYPQCSLTSGVVNFFLARTDAVQKVGFDPKLQRVAHSEFFMDGLGSLLVATCNHVSIGHQRKQNQSKYHHFRYPARSDAEFKLRLYFFKNHLKCIKYG
ncbi:beta-1,4 N-acetylgalactosaminyltransferase 2-like [Centropristis striata]|uniref:beta-1,4 N-acetylgalactosaminyltransferase 2-like n=1 Tax=Centropristis striata TaxID=184440 RepID=UPI0027E15C05|nr:beta-1,4 N-acetylgalactosaminyltransferase 2-like [Centropristis striata]